MKLLNYICILIASLLVLSCSDGTDETKNDFASGKMLIKFTISMGTNSTITRSGTWGDDDYDKSSATYWENSIQVGHLQVLVYDKDNKYIAQVSDLSYHRHADEDGNTYNNIYDILGMLSLSDDHVDSDGTLECKLVVLANYDSAIPEQTEGALLADMGGSNNSLIRYHYSADNIAAHTSYIPMWGVKTFTGSNALKLKVGTQTQAGEIFMLRAMSKIVVSLADDVTEEYTITSAKLSNYNYLGYIVPKEFSSVDETSQLAYNATDGTNPLSYNPYTSKANSSLSFVEETAGKRFVLYVPEYATTEDDNGNTTPQIILTLQDKDGYTLTPDYAINLRRYDDGVAKEVLSLVRNTIYNYTITGAKSVKYQAIDWNDKGGEVVFY